MPHGTRMPYLIAVTPTGTAHLLDRPFEPVNSASCGADKGGSTTRQHARRDPCAGFEYTARHTPVCHTFANAAVPTQPRNGWDPFISVDGFDTLTDYMSLAAPPSRCRHISPISHRLHP